MMAAMIRGLSTTMYRFSSGVNEPITHRKNSA